MHEVYRRFYASVSNLTKYIKWKKKIPFNKLCKMEKNCKSCTGQTNMIRRITNREYGVSRHHGGSFEGPSLKPLNTIVPWWSEGFRRSPQLGPHDTKRCQSLEQLHAWSLLFFPVWFFVSEIEYLIFWILYRIEQNNMH